MAHIAQQGFCTKGHLISKDLVGILNSSKKQTKKFDIQYYDTSGRLVFVGYWEELKTPKSPFEINCPLEMAMKIRMAKFWETINESCVNQS